MTKKKTAQEKTPHPYLRRITAFLIDWYFSSLLAMIPVIVFQSINGKDLVFLNRIDNLSIPQAVIGTILALIIYTLYFCVFPLKQHGGFKAGQTLGRRILGLTLVKTDNSALTFKNLFLRDFVGVLLLQGNTTSIYIYLMSLVQIFTGSSDFVAVLQLAYYILLALSLMLLFTKRKQTLQDILGQTRMIKINDLDEKKQ